MESYNESFQKGQPALTLSCGVENCPVCEYGLPGVSSIAAVGIPEKTKTKKQELDAEFNKEQAKLLHLMNEMTQLNKKYLTLLKEKNKEEVKKSKPKGVTFKL